jgi:hypothetical protein
MEIADKEKEGTWGMEKYTYNGFFFRFRKPLHLKKNIIITDLNLMYVLFAG